jgi:metal-responsive CopG/Arc/MetJ family transcriptional regulator
VAEVAIREITMRLPEELLQSLDETVKEGSLTRDEVLVRLVEDYVQRRDLEKEIAKATLARLEMKDLGFYGDLTYRYLSGELERTHSIDDIELGSEEIVEAIYRTFGTRDPIELIEKVRYREI